MQRLRSLLGLAAILNAIVLVMGMVCYRAGLFDNQRASAQPVAKAPARATMATPEAYASDRGEPAPGAQYSVDIIKAPVEKMYLSAIPLNEPQVIIMRQVATRVAGRLFLQNAYLTLLFRDAPDASSCIWTS
jgi:hypothetical protein